MADELASRSIHDLISLTDRTALVTGAGRGIGAAVSSRMAEAGARVVVADVDGHEATTTARGLDESGTEVVAIGADVSDETTVGALFDEAEDRLGPVDILVNNAGIFPIAPVVGGPTDTWRRVLEVNLTGAYLCAREMAGRAIARGAGGVVVNLCSTQSLKAAAPGLSAYTASKHGLAGLTQGLALELGPAGIRVLGVAPTLVETPGLEAQRPVFEAAGVGDIVAQTAASLPLGRVAQPDDVARVVVFAASDLASLMTGSLLLVDAGAMTL